MLFTNMARAQAAHEVQAPPKPDIDTSVKKKVKLSSYTNLDLIDIGLAIIGKNELRKPDTLAKRSDKVFASPVPGFGYSLQTGFEASLISNLAFYTGNPENANISSITTSLNYTQYHQFLFPIQANMWTNNNKYNIQADWHYVQFPQATYGLGGYTQLGDGYTINYSSIRLYTTVFRSFGKDLYYGLGYDYEYLWNVHEVNPPAGKETDFEKYGIIPTSIVSGLNFSFLYDTRRNSINPEGGSLLNIIYRPNLTFLGSDVNWQSVVMDARKFIKLPFGSKNVLALWNYDWFTPGPNKPPYALLPNTGGDPYGNTGRGYTEGRFRGRDMIYAEAEYRFGITNNGLLGGVIFTNIESFTEQASGRFEVFYPGYGLGLRIKFNKYSRTNVALDYAWGIDGSRGVFLNLGEIF